MKLNYLPAVLLGTLTTAVAAQTAPETVPSSTLAIDRTVMADPPEPVTLRLKVIQGQQYNLRLFSKQKISQTVMGRKMDIGLAMRMGMAMRVLSVDAEGVMAIDTTYTSMAMTSTVGSPGQKTISVSFDSERPPAKADPQMKMATAIVGQSIVMKLSPTGAVKGIEGLDRMWKNMIAKMDLPKGADKAALERTMAAMKEQFGEEKLRNHLNSFAMYPVDPVNIGDSWDQNTSLNVGYPISTKSKYTLQKVDGGVANITLASVLAMSPGKASAKSALPPGMKFSLSGNMGGTLTVNLATGFTQNAAIDFRFAGRMSMPDPEHRGKTISWPIYAKGNTTMEAIPADPNIIRIND